MIKSTKILLYTFLDTICDKMQGFGVCLVVILSLVSQSYGFLVEGWTEEWEYANATDIEGEF